MTRRDRDPRLVVPKKTAEDDRNARKDAGAVQLREADRVVGVTAKLASCFTDFRAPARVEHDLETLVAQRVYGLALGYEDLNDHDVLRDDSVRALALGKGDITGAMRSRSRDLGHPLAGSSTLNRLELGDGTTAAEHRYKRIVADSAAIDAQMVALFVALHATAPTEIVLDLDATDDPVHGHQEGRFFHGYYGG
ncbi:MAG: transposase [Chloroflexi bacterium]|nr:transposase [Chloroflexota bacterium]